MVVEAAVVEVVDLVPSGLLERTDAERDLAPAVVAVVVVVLPSLPAMRCSASCRMRRKRT